MGSNTEREKYIDDLARAFHREYRKVFISPEWDQVGSEFKRAVLKGVAAVYDHTQGVPRSTKEKPHLAREQSRDVYQNANPLFRPLTPL